MDYTMDDVKRMLHKAVEIMRSGLAEDATDEDKAKMQTCFLDRCPCGYCLCDCCYLLPDKSS